ncbi:AMP-binding protein [Fibrella sp. HMF5335]|uniref:AMP-binding protein n=1 Tax=Fibrella rubiginis TaxID=2817060 RepID=A0A939K2Y4_9BACT|nr:AMP-binding protein [Fibrella rubiginis]MBO0938677.1 AMP-binding protein [Fibrella rubiginis]
MNLATSPATQTAPATLTDFFLKWEKSQPEKIYLRQPVGDAFIDYTWAEVGQQARRMATYLQSLGLPHGSNIGLVSKNCAHWLIADLAIFFSGHVSVPFYATLNAGQIQQVMEHSGCQALFVGKLDDNPNRWAGMKPGVPAGVNLIGFPDYAAINDADLVPWDHIMATCDPLQAVYQPQPDDLYTIIYTSGTTGNPKGVMIDYRAVAEAVSHTSVIMKHNTPNARFFSYLPLCHVAERNVVQATSLATGGTVYFAESLETFAKNLAVAKPTHFLAVPRIWTKFQLGILAKMPQKKLDLFLKIPILSGIVKKKIREGLGLNEAVLILTGAAPMPKSLILWFRRLGIIIQEAYGMTENLGAVSMMPTNDIRDGSVGKVYPGMAVKIDPQTGEILTKSGWLMRGYYKEPTLTASVLQDGWLATGDVGTLDKDGYLTITGRVKEMYKTAKGEYIAPSQIEFGFADNMFVEQICVAGQHLPQPLALIVLSDMGRQAERIAVERSLEDTINALNPKLHNYERVRKVVIVRDPWTVDNNLMTPTMKIKRNVIEARYDAQLQPWYENDEVIIWE